MTLRSLLFVPADSERKLSKSLASPADVLILDLEDAVADSRKRIAREMAAAHLVAHGPASAARLYVRINPLDTPHALADLAAVVGPGLAGILLPKIQGAAELQRLSIMLDVLEVRAGLGPGSVRMIPVATETGQAMLNLGTLGLTALPRLEAVTWGAEDLAAAVGALSNREEDGRYSPLFDMAANVCLCAAAAAGVVAVDTISVNFKDPVGLAADCRVSRRRGFKGRMAIHPDQVPVINEAYAPSAEEIAHARRIVEAFAAQPDAGALSIDGKMIDKPHLVQAQRTLAGL